MKKKIALLLAAAMTFAAAVPMNLFAAASNVLTTQVNSNAAKDMFFDLGLSVGEGATITGNDDLAASNRSVNLVVNFPERTVTTGDNRAFRLTLSDNAEWFFVDYGSTIGGTSATSTYQKSTEVDITSTASGAKGFTAMGRPASESAYFAELVNTSLSGTGAAANGENQNFLVYNAGIAGNSGREGDFALNRESAQTVAIYYNEESGMSLSIPLVIRSKDDKPISITVTGAADQVLNSTVAITRGTRGTTNTIASQRTGRNVVALDKITLTEVAAGSIRSGQFVISAPDDYKLVATSDFKLTFHGLSAATTSGVVTGMKGTNDLYIKLDGVVPTTALPGKIDIEGLVLQPLNSAISIDYNEDLSIEIKELEKAVIESGDNNGASFPTWANITGISKGVIEKAAKFINWSVGYVAADAKDVLAGRNKQEAAKVTISEKVPGSWWTQKDTVFTLVDAEGNVRTDVKISSAKINATGFTVEEKGVTFHPIYNDTLRRGSTVDKDGNVNENVILFNNNANGFSFVGRDIASDKSAKVEIELVLSTAFTAEGPVYLKAENSSFGIDNSDIDDSGMIKIAEIERLVDIKAETTDVEIGAQRYDIKNITVTELKKGALLPGNVVFDLGEFGSTITTSGLRFVPLSAAGKMTVTTSDRAFKIEGVSSNGDNITYRVATVSRDLPASIELSGLQATIDRTVPRGLYDLFVSGPALTNNFDGTVVGGTTINDSFSNRVFSLEGYITVVTDQANVAFRSEIKIFDGSTTAIIDGKPVEMAMAPYADLNDSAFLVPVRFVTENLGAKVNFNTNGDKNIVTVEFAERTVQFTIGEKEYFVSGAPLAYGMSTAPVVQYDENGGGYTFLPFRALGEAIGVPVDFLAEEGAAVYNLK